MQEDGLPRSYYATPWELRRRPWALDFTPDNKGALSFPENFLFNPNILEDSTTVVDFDDLASKEDPKVTAQNHGLRSGDIVKITGVADPHGTDVNDQSFVIDVIDSGEFQLLGADTSHHPDQVLTGQATVQDYRQLSWSNDDWDPALRYWSLPFDEELEDWLASANIARPSIMAAREFAAQADSWHPEEVNFLDLGWMSEADLAWWPYDKTRPEERVLVPQDFDAAWDEIKSEIEQLKIYMKNDRLRYLDESDVQADGIDDYIIQLISADATDHPWTLELIDCGLAIGNVAYMAYKAHFRRVRPSIIMPGLMPPFGPPEHPAFPSGHAFIGFFVGLLLLEIPGLADRFGVFRPDPRNPNDPQTEVGAPLDRPFWEDLQGEQPVDSPMFIIANRIAVNRERIGVHYPSDSFASRHLAAGIWNALMPESRFESQPRAGIAYPASVTDQIRCPHLDLTLERAKAEWVQPVRHTLG